jgi:outer membrane protein assembly factor BamA
VAGAQSDTIAPSQLGKTVAQVELRLPPGADAQGLAALVETHPGQRLTLHNVRRTLERLFATGRFSDVVARATPLGEGVALSFELTPIQRVTRLGVEGNHILSESQITAAARLSEGSEYDAERAEEARVGVLTAYRQRGYASARVEVLASPGGKGVAVKLRVSEGPPTLLAGFGVEGDPGVSVGEAQKALGLEVGAPFDPSALEAGLDRLRDLLRRRHYFRAEVGALRVELVGEQARVILPLKAGPQVTFRFHGNHSLPDAELLGVLRYDGQEALDRSMEERLAQRVANYYRYQGFLDASVLPAESVSASRAHAVLAFEINERAPVRVVDISVQGNSAVPSAELLHILRDTVLARQPLPEGDVHPTDDPVGLEGRSPGAAPDGYARLTPDEVFVEEPYREATDSMVRLYREAGFLSATVTVDQVLVDDSTHEARVRIRVNEGPRTWVDRLVVEGVPQGVTLEPPMGLGVGQAFRPSALDEARVELLHALGAKGFLFARVDDREDVSPDGSRCTVVLRVEAGPQVRVGHVILKGMVRTREALVRANLHVHPGGVLDADALLDTQHDLQMLGIFRQVSVHLLDPDLPEPNKDVVVEMKERPRFSNELTFGYYLANGPRVGGLVNMPNFLGRGIELSFRGSVNYVGLSTLPLVSFEPASELQGINGINFRTNISLHQPRVYDFFPLLIGLRLDLVAERIQQPAYQYTRFAAIAGADWHAAKWLNLSLQAQVEEDAVSVTQNVQQLVAAYSVGSNLEALRFPEGTFVLASAGPSASLDFRDNPVNPSRGWLFAVSAEVAHDLGIVANDDHFFNLKTSGNLSFYVPLGNRTVLAVSFRGGRFFFLEPGQSETQQAAATLPPKRFYLGGATTLRGFSEDGVLPQDERQGYHQQLADCRALLVANPNGCTPGAAQLLSGGQVPSQGGTLYTLGKAELRFPVARAVDLGVFFEAGSLWLQPYNFQVLKLRYVAGTGVRYVTPVGPLALDVGFNLFPDALLNEPTFQINFAVGLF